MMEFAGFRVVDECRYSPLLIDILAEVVPEPSFIPPLGFSRVRGRELLQRLPSIERPSWWTRPESEPEISRR